MRLFLIFIATLLFAEVKITNVDIKNRLVEFDKYVKKGVSGEVLCNYLNEKIICAKVVSLGHSGILFNYNNLKNDAFARPIVLPKKNDEVIFAKDYNRVMILAPNQQIYLKIKSLYKNNIVISPDVLAAFLDGKISTKILREFAQNFNIGRFIIFENKEIYEVDSFSFYVINKQKIDQNAEYKKAFFTYCKNFDIKKVDYKKLLKGLND